MSKNRFYYFQTARDVSENLCFLYVLKSRRKSVPEKLINLFNFWQPNVTTARELKHPTIELSVFFFVDVLIKFPEL